MTESTKDINSLREENKALKRQLEEAQKTMASRDQNGIDLLLEQEKDAGGKYQLQHSDLSIYRLLIEKMNEGAAVVNQDLIMVYANSRLAMYLEMPLHKVIGSRFDTHVPAPEHKDWRDLLQITNDHDLQYEINIPNQLQENTTFNCAVSSYNQDNKKYFIIILSDISRHKKAEQAIRKSESQWRSLVENIPSVITRYNPDHQFTFINQPFEKLFDKKRDDVLGQTPIQVFGESNAFVSWMENLEKAGQSSEIISFPSEYLINHQQRYFINSLVPETDPDGKIYSVLAISKDISEIIHQERQLKKTNAKLNTAQELAQIGSWEWNLENDQITFSENLRQIWQFSSDQEITHQVIMDKVHENDQVMVQNILSGKIDLNQPFDYQFRIYTRDNQIKHLQGRSNALPDHASQVKKIFGVTQDVTQLKQAEEKLIQLNQELEAKVEERTRDLKKSNHQLDLALNQEKKALAQVEAERKRLYDLFIDAPGLICLVKGPDYKIEFANLAYQEAFEYKKVIGRSIFDVFPEINQQDIVDILHKVYREGKTFSAKNYKVRIKNEEKKIVYLYFNFVYQPYTNPDGNIEGILMYAYDVTDQVRARHALGEKNEELQEVNKYLDNFVHTVAHDLRSPTANLQALLQILKNSPPEQQDQLVEMMQKGVDKLDRTLEGLIQIIDAQGRKVVSEPKIGVKQVIDEVLEDEQNRIREKGANIHLDIQDNLQINYVRAYLFSVVKNMTSNALKYASPRRPLQLDIAVEKVDHGIRLIFEDNGIGIDLQKYSRNLFQPFKRFATGTKGLGIGLYIIKTMVEKNGGNIAVESEPGQGTTFTIFLKEYNPA
ncbi:MAG: PAS domain-containing protein [Candidatus Cyclobacteriaceae bacterium M3_2C_046]